MDPRCEDDLTQADLLDIELAGHLSNFFLGTSKQGALLKVFVLGHREVDWGLDSCFQDPKRSENNFGN